MKFVKLTLSLLVVFSAAVGFMSCGGDSPAPSKSDAQKLSKTWRIATATSNGSAVAFSTTGFRLTLTATNDGQADSYTIVPGGISTDNPRNLPNYNAPATSNTGKWSLSGSTLVFDPNGTASQVSILDANINEETLTLQWKMPKAEDKNEPTYRFNLVPAQ